MSVTCWENPEECRGCTYCDGGSPLTPEQAHRMELGSSPDKTEEEKEMD